MADGNDVKLSFNKEITINEGMKYKKILKESDLKGEAKTWLKTIFDAIDSQGNTKNKTDNCELSLLEKLSQAIEGEINEEQLKKFMAEVHSENQEKGKNLEAAIVDYLNTYIPEPEKTGTETTTVADPAGVTPGADDTARVTDNSNGEGTDSVVTVKEDGGDDDGKKSSVSVDGKSSQKAFNQTINNIVQKNGYTKASLNNFTENYKIQKGDNLYKIAVKTLQGQGKETPGWKEINELIAQIKVANDIKDVNRILVGQEIKLPKAGGTEPPTGGTETPAGGTEPPAGRTEPAAFNPESNVARDAAGESSVKVTDNFDPEGWKSTEVEGEEGITKYTRTEGEGESAVTETKYTVEVGGVTIAADTLEGVKALKQEFEANQPAGKPEGEESAEDAAKRKDLNLDKLKSQMSLLQNTEDVILYVIDQLKNPDITDSSSDKFKALVLDLLKTGDPEVVAKLMLKDDEFDSTLFTKDETSFKTAADMYKAIRDKELRGERLSDTEHALKDTFQESQYKDGFHIEADPEKGVVEKYLAMDSDGNLQYNSPTGVRAADSGLLDEFVTELNAADTDEKKAALFKKYAATTDKVLAANLAANTENKFKASKEDIETLINNSDLKTLSYLNVKDDYKEELYKKAAEKAKELFLSDKGNLDNARYLEGIFDKIDKSGLTNEEKSKIKTEILDSFFTVTTTEDGTKTYKFEPSRRPTYEEMVELAGYATNEMKEALVKSIKLEDMGINEYTAAIEFFTASSVVVAHFAQLVDDMTKEEEVLDFIKNKVRYRSDIPNDKILEKFPKNQEIRELLIRNYIDESIISDANRLSLIKDYIKIDGENWSLIDELPEGITVDKLIALLPSECDEGEARKVFDTILALDTSKLSQDVKNKMFDRFFKEQTVPTERFNTAVNNGWIKDLGYDIIEVDPESEILYDTNWVRKDKEGNITSRYFMAISRDGYNKGLAIYEDVHGAGHGSVRDKLKEEGYFTKDNIIGIITTFNNITQYENIIGYIDNEWGPTQAEMNVIPNTLLALAAEKGLSTDETYKELNDLIKTQTKTRSDYGDKTAKQIDDLMIELIKKIEAKRE